MDNKNFPKSISPTQKISKTRKKNNVYDLLSHGAPTSIWQGFMATRRERKKKKKNQIGN